MAQPSITPTHIDDLRWLLPEAEVSAGESVLDLHSRDESHHPPRRPELVIWPTETGQVATVLRYASAHGLAVTPWAGGTSLEGNPVPTRGGIVLDFTRMDRVLAIRGDDLQVDVQPGVPYRRLNEQLAAHGLFFPPDPGASALIGGMIGNNASGVRTVAYGGTRDRVLALELVLADGRVLELGSRAIKSSAGYDLVSLVVGSEGTLGVVTRATLRLQGLPASHLAMVATLPSVPAACAAVAATIRFGLQPAALELMDQALVRAINLDRGTTLTEAPTLFLEFHNVTDDVLATQATMVTELLEEHGASGVRAGVDPAERLLLWEARHGALESIKRSHPGQAVLLVDSCVPIGAYASLVDQALAAVRAEGVTGYFWGHAGDGNLHLGLVHDPDDQAAMEAVERVNHAVVTAGLALGGTCTGEHGIGMGKRGFMAQEHGDAVALMRGIKVLFDPKGILNPGKILPEG
jgi:D-lactate dehydrogenase (cytochrome)